MALAGLTYPLRLLGASSKLRQVLDSEPAEPLTAAGDPAWGRAGGHPGDQSAGRQCHSSARSTASRQPPPPHGVGAACRPTPPGGPTLLARQVGPQCGEHPSHCLHGQGWAYPATVLLGLATRASPTFPSFAHGARAASSGRCKTRSSRDSDCSGPCPWPDQPAHSGAHSPTRPSRARPRGPW